MGIFRICSFAVLSGLAFGQDENAEGLIPRVPIGYIDLSCFSIPRELPRTPADGIVWSNTFRAKETASRLFINVAVTNRGSGEWTLEAKGSKDKTAHKVSFSEAADLKQFTIGPLFGNRADLVLRGDSTGLKLSVPSCAVEMPPARVQNRIDADDLEDITKLRNRDRMYDVGRSVARLTIVEPNAIYPCTGFLIAPSYLLTARHCFSSQFRKIIAEFNYETGQLSEIVARGVTKIVAESPRREADFAILDISESVDLPLTLFPTISPRLASQFQMNVIQHPSGQVKQIVRRDCSVVNEPDRKFFFHRCDTEGGSSGSPMLDPSGKLVGMHQAGFLEGIPNGLNAGIPLSYILSELALAKNKETYDKIKNAQAGASR